MIGIYIWLIVLSIITLVLAACICVLDEKITILHSQIGILHKGQETTDRVIIKMKKQINVLRDSD